LVMLVTCRYESFPFSSYSYILWQLEFYLNCSQLRFFMNELSTLRSIVILLVIISNMAPLLCLLFLLPCRFLYQVAFHFSFSFSSWQTLDACSCRIVSLRGDIE
jgi:hypothetical protein